MRNQAAHEKLEALIEEAKGFAWPEPTWEASAYCGFCESNQTVPDDKKDEAEVLCEICGDEIGVQLSQRVATYGEVTMCWPDDDLDFNVVVRFRRKNAPSEK